MEEIDIVLSDQEIILKNVSESQKISIPVITGKSRKGEIIFARHTYCYISNILLRLEKLGYPGNVSLAIIGNLINRDHASVLHGWKEIQNRVDTERVVKFKIEILLNKCRKEILGEPQDQTIITDFTFI
jgi:chromosomal replication initiation ATPase DnaA